MKIFYVFATKNNKNDSGHNANLIDFLRSKRHRVRTYTYVITDTIEQDFEDKNPRKIISQIKNADVFIGEMSRASQTLGFLLSFAVQNMKPSLYLYPSKSLGKPGKIITSNPSRLITVENYDHENYQEKVSKFLIRAERQLKTTRTTFVSTKEIDDFINQESKKSGLSKGEIIRGVFEEKLV